MNNAGPYIALRKLRIPNGPGKFPSSIRVGVGEVFSLDGDEPINVHLLLKQRAIQPYKGDIEKLLREDEPQPKRRGAK